jgi:ribonuclease P protein component
MTFTRLGLSVSKRVAGGGVMRNRIRRRLRDAFRRARPELAAGYDLIVSARSAKLPKGSALDAMLVDLIGQVIRKAIQRTDSVRPGPAAP